MALMCLTRRVSLCLLYLIVYVFNIQTVYATTDENESFPRNMQVDTDREIPYEAFPSSGPAAGDFNKLRIALKKLNLLSNAKQTKKSAQDFLMSTVAQNELEDLNIQGYENEEWNSLYVIPQSTGRNRRAVVSAPEERTSEVAFSEWGAWTECDANGCSKQGRQMRMRTCYGNDIGASKNTACSYENLVDRRPCTGPSCITDVVGNTPELQKSWSEWSEWSKCSITCGVGGSQSRFRTCSLGQTNRTEVAASVAKCDGSAKTSRPCQYSVSCAKWDSWNQWSACSKTCGNGGLQFRERKCFVERYFALRLMSGEKNVTNSNKNTTEPLKLDMDIAKSNFAQMAENGLVFINKESIAVYIVDAEIPKQYDHLREKFLPEFYNINPEKVVISSEACENNGGSPEEQKVCNTQNTCPSKWGAWQAWSACSVTCGIGIGKKERICYRNTEASPCDGRKFLYRRCYAPPCWSQWVDANSCSATCGPGHRLRTRLCLLPAHPRYRFCIGPSAETRKCNLKPCPGTWGAWSEFNECSVTCNGGYKHRNRTCTGSTCIGISHQLVLCNDQRCPTWNRWSAFSCCNVSCGRGYRERKRTCRGGPIGQKGCDGKTMDVEYCYRKPCGETAKPSVFGSLSCGIRSGMNLKNSIQLRIFGGTNSVPHGWPWQASWQHRIHAQAKWLHFCGGTLIHPRWVLTAGHCIEEAPFVVNHNDPGQTWSVVLGMDKLYKDGQRFFADRVFVHSQYEHKTVTNNDIALIKLRQMAAATDTIAPACLPGGLEPAPGEQCYVTGWGFTDPNGNHSESLMEAAIPIVDFNKCRNLGDYYRYFLNRTIHMCAGFPDSKTAVSDSCTGDSGGPLMCKNGDQWYITAVTSFGFADCATPGHAGIYSPIKTFQPWIRKTVDEYTYEKC